MKNHQLFRRKSINYIVLSSRMNKYVKFERNWFKIKYYNMQYKVYTTRFEHDQVIKLKHLKHFLLVFKYLINKVVIDKDSLIKTYISILLIVSEQTEYDSKICEITPLYLDSLNFLITFYYWQILLCRCIVTNHCVAIKNVILTTVDMPSVQCRR